MKLSNYLVTILSVILFVLLFFEKSLGLNVALYGVVTVALLIVNKPTFFKPLLNKIVGVGFLTVCICYYLFASPFTLFIALVSFGLLFGLHSSSHFRNLLYAIPNSIVNYFYAFRDLFSSFRSRRLTNRKFSMLKVLKIVFLPLFIIFLFVAMYSMGSSFFSDFVGSLGAWIGDILAKIGKYINIVAVFLALLGLIFGVLHSLQSHTTSFSTMDGEGNDRLSRIRNRAKSRFNNLDLKVEYLSGVFLLSALNLMLVLVLYLEIKNIWFGFQWDGALLKSLVHEGTYVLIFAILVSMLVVVYYFRKNLNFYKQNRTLKALAFTWIGLNAVLVISVFVRNLYYVQYFGLAYKRIGVVFFLVLCLVGLVTLVLKIYKVKSLFYVLRINALAAYITLVGICIFNWDVIIAKYNFGHYKTAFIHLPYMSSLSDKGLPYLQVSDAMIEEIEDKQTEAISFARKGYFKEVEYQAKIAERVAAFRKRHSETHWLESVWAESKAYELLN